MEKCLQSTGLCCFKLSKNSQILLLENKIAARQKKFGIDYLTLVEEKAPESQLKRCVKDALDDIHDIKDDIQDQHEKIDVKTNEVSQRMNANANANANPPATAARPSRSPSATAPASKMGPTKRNMQKNSNNNNNNTTSSNTTNKNHGTKPPVPKRNNNTPVGNGGKNGKAKPPFPSSSSNGNNKSVAKKIAAPPSAAAAGGRHSKKNNAADKNDGPEIPDAYQNSDPSKWRCREYKFSGQAKFTEKGTEDKVKGSQLSISKGLQKFKANPGRYTCMAYQSEMKDWPEKDQQYIMMHRKGTIKWRPQGISPKGWMTVHVNEYERLVPFKDNILPKKFRDNYTDAMTFQGKRLHSAKNKPILPGRGMGHGDSPELKIIGDVDPSDIFQGSVGDCWLLSGISSVAEFDGAIKRLFRKTKNLHKMPMDGGNMYTVTLWDLTTWTEVDIVIDERLPAHYDGSGNILAGKPSEDGELWACYLEKALAVHSGGWDKIVGGQCTHAWALLTGCKEQYTMGRNPATGKWRCFAKFNPKTKEWAKHENSPHDCANTTWRVGWPTVGGGGSRDLELDDEEMFLRLFAWDQVNYIVGAGTSGTSDKQSTGGIVDNHAYSVIESVDNVAGTDIDLIKVRNPWGSGEIEDGEFDDDGPGWDKYPQIKKALNPVVADDGIFWVTKKEFFVFFETIYLSASNMTEFLED